MAISRQHVDRLIPWLLEVVEEYPFLDEVDWTLEPVLTPAMSGPPGQFALRWHLFMSIPSPLINQHILVSTLADEIFLAEDDFKEWVLESLRAMTAQRQAILDGAAPDGLNGV